MKKIAFRWFPWIGALAVFVLCLCVLTGELGLSDNGDFARVMKSTGVTFASEPDPWRYQNEYRMDPKGDGFFSQFASLMTDGERELYSSPQFLVVRAAKAVSFLYNCVTGQDKSVFYMGALFGICLLLFGFAAGGILHGLTLWRTRIAALAVLLFVFCDMGYLLYFHSFYGETLQFVCTMIAAAALLHLVRAPSVFWTVIGLLAAFFIAGAKLANIPFALLIAAAVGVTVRTRKRLWIPTAVCLLAILLLVGSVPEWMNRSTDYQAVFYGVLKDSDTPREDLAQLGLPQEYEALQNTHAYLESYPIDIGSEQFEREFYQTVGKGSVAWFYLRHPIRLCGKMNRAITYGGSIRPPSLANSAGERMEKTERFSLWSALRLKSGVLYAPPIMWLLLLGMAAGAIVLLIRCIRKRAVSACSVPILLLAAGLWLNLALPIVGNGEADLAKHLFFFIHLTDLTVAAGIVAAVYEAPRFPVRVSAAVAAAAVAVLLWNLPWGSRADTVSFGGYQWTVLEETDTAQTLVCAQTVACRPFDRTGEYGQNRWEQSELRRWLNEELFSPEDRERLLPMTYSVSLSKAFRSFAESGWHEPIWTHDPATAAEHFESVWKEPMTDRVALLTLPAYRDGGFCRDIGQEYWLADPYGGNESMVRYADRFGQVLHCDACRSCGVRPVITLKKE